MLQPVRITCEDYTVRKEMSEFTVELRFNTQLDAGGSADVAAL